MKSYSMGRLAVSGEIDDVSADAEVRLLIFRKWMTLRYC